MGLISKLGDTVAKGITGAQTVRVPYDVLSQLVAEEFISGADDACLGKVLKTAKGGFFFPKEMKSKNERYDFHVGTRPNGCALLNSKPVWVFDHEANKFYQLDKNIKWKNFYKAIKAAVQLEKINRNR